MLEPDKNEKEVKIMRKIDCLQFCSIWNKSWTYDAYPQNHQDLSLRKAGLISQHSVKCLQYRGCKTWVFMIRSNYRTKNQKMITKWRNRVDFYSDLHHLPKRVKYQCAVGSEMPIKIVQNLNDKTNFAPRTLMKEIMLSPTWQHVTLKLSGSKFKEGGGDYAT